MPRGEREPGLDFREKRHYVPGRPVLCLCLVGEAVKFAKPQVVGVEFGQHNPAGSSTEVDHYGSHIFLAVLGYDHSLPMPDCPFLPDS